MLKKPRSRRARRRHSLRKIKRRVKTKELLSRERNIIKVLKETYQDQHVVPALVVEAEAAQEVKVKEEEDQMGLHQEVISEEVTNLRER
jgi:predicted alpha-1,6-mannanase (GH76 family)